MATTTTKVPGPAAPKPITFPYRTWEAAVKDEFKKVGGLEGAFRLLVKGWKTSAWRKRAENNAREAIKREDARLAAMAASATTKSAKS
jgi:hypothetical protein